MINLKLTSKWSRKDGNVFNFKLILSGLFLNLNWRSGLDSGILLGGEDTDGRLKIAILVTRVVKLDAIP